MSPAEGERDYPPRCANYPPRCRSWASATSRQDPLVGDRFSFFPFSPLPSCRRRRGSGEYTLSGDALM